MTFKLSEFSVTYKTKSGEIITRYTYAETLKEAKRNWENARSKERTSHLKENFTMKLLSGFIFSLFFVATLFLVVTGFFVYLLILSIGVISFWLYEQSREKFYVRSL